jgi:hypothetical protein
MTIASSAAGTGIEAWHSLHRVIDIVRWSWTPALRASAGTTLDGCLVMPTTRATRMNQPRPRQALAELAAQHAALRDRIARCEALADELDAGRAELAQLLREVAALRIAFDAHNQLEEPLLHPELLDAPDWLGPVRIARMVEDHVEAHRAIRRDFAPETAAELRRVLASLLAHLDAEERQFASRKPRRDDLAR